MISIDILQSLIEQLSIKGISGKYIIYYFRLFVELKGAKGNLSHKELANLWKIKLSSVKNILSYFERFSSG